jgi:hypothetical protein
MESCSRVATRCTSVSTYWRALQAAAHARHQLVQVRRQAQRLGAQPQRLQQALALPGGREHEDRGAEPFGLPGAQAWQQGTGRPLARPQEEQDEPALLGERQGLPTRRFDLDGEALPLQRAQGLRQPFGRTFHEHEDETPLSHIFPGLRTGGTLPRPPPPLRWPDCARSCLSGSQRVLPPRFRLSEVSLGPP